MYLHPDENHQTETKNDHRIPYYDPIFQGGCDTVEEFLWVE